MRERENNGGRERGDEERVRERKGGSERRSEREGKMEEERDRGRE